ncbi:MAG: hypothetical protein B7Y25_00650 [Alphaproteobacteria bacterium 16-39-46]|nr:MAG: hypothetical protein B7Y25_00650 [Alphaproteobacteria bacterium 16-39-46]OZA44349.1 MAG: hypothetical protein B7X84_00655 [Alphaproteobacteria bacterium 17-39-52]HQS83419.1 hypothetical protein [Alphaproteobacteria bacterium]HQS93183.1 hypothetical protein [Alphaproteobacteria bacterium]
MKPNRKMLSLSGVAGVLSILCFSSMGMCSGEVRFYEKPKEAFIDHKKKALVIGSKGTLAKIFPVSPKTEQEGIKESVDRAIVAVLNEKQ